MGSLGCKNKHELPKVDLSGLDLSELGTDNWASARAEVSWSLANYGGFEVIYDRVKPNIHDGLLERVMPEAFTKSKLNGPSLLNYDGLWIQRDSELMPFKSLKVADPDSLVAVHQYANKIWPQGSEIFCNTIWNYAKQMKGLIEIIHRMILESLGLEGYYDSHIKSLAYSIRLSEYNSDIQKHGKKAGIPPHVDPNFMSIICQQEEGLEVETSNGEWLHVAAMPNSFIVLLGEIFTAWTNGIFQAPKHRVKIDGKEKRYSAIFNTFPTFNENMIHTPDELVDEKHPLLFKPFKYYDYIKFRHSDEGEKHQNALEAYCGVEPTKRAV